MGVTGCRWLILLALSWPWLAVHAGGTVADGSKLPGAVFIDHRVNLPLEYPSRFYTHVADLHVYLTAQHTRPLAGIKTELNRAQEKFDRCRIYLRLRSVNRLAAPPLLAQWESLEFGMGLTPWERALFVLAPAYSAGIVYVDSLDWTIGRNGITAVGYAPFIETETDYLKDDAERAFYRVHMAGHAVLGRHSGQWTLAHELGHALMNLRHVGDQGNVMFGGQMARNEKLGFSESQCEQGRANAPWVKRVERGAPEDRLATVIPRRFGFSPWATYTAPIRAGALISRDASVAGTGGLMR